MRNKLWINVIVITLLCGWTSTLEAQLFNSSMSDTDKKQIVKKMGDVLSQNTGQMSAFWIGKANDGSIFFNYCSISPMRFSNGYERIAYPENTLAELLINETKTSGCDRTKNTLDQYVWYINKKTFDEQGRFKEFAVVAEIHKSSARDAALLYTYEISRHSFVYPDENTMVITSESYQPQPRKNSKPELKFSSVITIEKNGNQVILKKEETSFYRKGGSKTALSQTDVELDEAGRLATGKQSMDEIPGMEISCEYNEKGWLSAYKQTLYHYKTGELTGVTDVKVSYTLNDSEANPDREDAYTTMTMEDIYNAEKELIKQVDGLNFRLKNSDGTWGAWKGTSY